MFTVTKDGQTMQLHDKVQLAAFKKSGWSEVGGGDQHDPPHQEPPAPMQYGYSPPAPEPYAPERLEQMERKDLFTIADSLGIEYPPNIPTARLIEQILASQNQAR